MMDNYRHISFLEFLGFRKRSGARQEEKELRPNRLTRKVIRDADRGKNVRSFDTFEEAMKWLES